MSLSNSQLGAKRWKKELRRRRVVRPSRRRRALAKALFMRKFRRLSLEEARKRRKQQVKIETTKAAPAVVPKKEAPKKAGWLGTLFGRKTGG